MKKYFKFLVIAILLLLLVGCKEQFTVIFDANGGTLTGEAAQFVEDGDQVVLPSDPVREGYTFEGWYLGEEKWSFATNVVTINLTLAAKWKEIEKKKYTLTIDYADDVRDNLVLGYNLGDAIVIDDPTRVGYTFKGWKEEVPTKMPDKDFKLTATWEVNKYTLTIKYNDGVTADLVVSMNYGESLNFINTSKPTRSGYYFIKWDNYSDTMPDKDLTIEANWGDKFTNILGSGNLYLTAFGQASYDYGKEIVDEAVDGTALEGKYTAERLLTADQVIAGDVVIAVVGYTTKGIDTKTVTVMSEMARAKAFAEKEGITLIIMQLEGKARRGESSDPIIEAACKGADYVFVYEDHKGNGANFDGMYSTNWCLNNKHYYEFDDEWDIYEYIRLLVD